MGRFGNIVNRFQSSAQRAVRAISGTIQPGGTSSVGLEHKQVDRPSPDHVTAQTARCNKMFLNQRIDVLDLYVDAAPDPQHALNIFRGEWLSKLPPPLAELQAGYNLLFEDARLEWGLDVLGGVQSKTVLELGPMEVGHTYMLERQGAASITSIEANTRAYLKCLIIKELLELRHARFLCGDFVGYLRTNLTQFDVCIASGVLYHMHNRIELIALIANVSSRLYLSTHYYDPAVISGNPELSARFLGSKPADCRGFTHTLYHKEYQAALNQAFFCGSGNTYSYWMTADDIVACLRFFGFNEIQTNFHQPDHPNGPAIALTAVRRP